MSMQPAARQANSSGSILERIARASAPKGILASRFPDDPESKRDCLRFFVETLAPAFRERGDKHIEHRLHECRVLRLAIASICGKRRKKGEPYALEHLGF